MEKLFFLIMAIVDLCAKQFYKFKYIVGLWRGDFDFNTVTLALSFIYEVKYECSAIREMQSEA